MTAMLSALKSLEWTGFPRRAALLAAALGLLVLAGWALDVPLLKSFMPGLIEMKANTALCFLLAGSALFLRLQSPVNQQTPHQRAAQGMALAAAAIGFATLGEYGFGWQLGLDQLLFREPVGALHILYPGRMSPYTATGFSASGFALLALHRPRLRLPLQLAAALTLLAGVVPLLGYLWGISTLTTASVTTPVALHTALGLILLGSALLLADMQAAAQSGHGSPLKPVESKVLLGFVGALTLILFSGGLTYRSSNNFAESAKWVAHTQEVRAVLGDFHSDILDAESAQRAYLLTAEAGQRALNEQIINRLPAEMELLVKLVGDNPEQMSNLDTLRSLTGRRLEILAQVRAAYEHQGLATAQKEIVTLQSVEIMNRLRALVNEIENVETKLLKEREAAAEHARRLTLIAMLSTLVLSMMVLTVMYVTIRREIRLRTGLQEQVKTELEQRVQERTEALREERDKLAVVFENTSMGLVLANAHGGDLLMNATALKFHGFDSVEDMHRRVEDYANEWELRYADGRLMPYDEWPLVRAMRGDYVRDLEIHYRNLGSGYQWVCSMTSVPVRNSSGEVVLIVMTLFDITERKRAEHEIITLNAELEKRVTERTNELNELYGEHTLILNSVSEGVHVINLDGKIIFENPAAAAMLGYEAQELVGKPGHATMHHTRADGSAYPSSECHIYATLHDGVPRHEADEVFWRKDGSSFQVDYYSMALRDVAGEITGVVVVFRDVTESKQYEHQLVAAKTAAELANRTKDSFLATMSHEIRTPLTGMLGMLELLSLTPTDREQGEMLKAVSDSSRSLLRIVNDILDWSKIEEGKLVLAPQSTSIPQLLQEVVNTYSRVASAKSLTLRQHADARLSAAHIVDALRLSQILNNFVSNAIKFTQRGEIELRAELLEQVESGERIRFSVKDTGIGIAKDAQQHLFQRYRQASADTARMYGGTGLGLAICRRLADLLDGQIELASEPGQGSTFSLTLTLPVSAAPGETVQAQYHEAEQRKVEPLLDGSGDAPLVLAVDDHPTNRDLLARQIKLLGLRAETAENGQVALSMWREGRFALVITDCHMPEMDGYALTQAIRKIEAGKELPRTPVIAWTANALAEEAGHCRAAGMDEMLVKPTNMAQLKKMLAKWLAIAETGNSQPAPSTHGAEDGQAAGPIDYAELNEAVPEHAEQIQVLHDFQAQIHADHPKLIEVLKQGDQVNTERTAHRMKGSCRMVGAREMASACAAIEQAARDGNMDGARAAMAGLDEAIKRFETYFTEGRL